MSKLREIQLRNKRTSTDRAIFNTFHCSTIDTVFRLCFHSQFPPTYVTVAVKWGGSVQLVHLPKHRPPKSRTYTVHIHQRSRRSNGPIVSGHNQFHVNTRNRGDYCLIARSQTITISVISSMTCHTLYNSVQDCAIHPHDVPKCTENKWKGRTTTETTNVYYGLNSAACSSNGTLSNFAAGHLLFKITLFLQHNWPSGIKRPT